MKTIRFAVILILALVGAARNSQAANPLRPITSGFLGTAGADDLQGAAPAGDGTFYVVGNMGETPTLPGAPTTANFGQAASSPRCGHGFVARLDAGGQQILNAALFGKGLVLLTSVQVNKAGVYVSGYAGEGLAALLRDKPGLIREYPLQREVELIRTGKILEATGCRDWKEDIFENRPGLGRYGAPFVVRLSPDLQTLECGTYLEGWQQVWDKQRVARIKPRQMFPVEYFWQPTALGLLQNGDLVVAHDGGYLRLLTDQDRELAKPEGAGRLIRDLPFYDTCDYVSRLTPNLDQRVWLTPVQTPKVNKTEVAKSRGPWPFEHYGNPRTHRLRLDSRDNIYIGGWSASHTSSEPWWAPFIWQLDPATGQLIKRVVEYDPFAGGGNRMGGMVADTAVLTVTPDNNDNLLASFLSDGGNTWMARGKVKGSTPIIKLVHWWGRTYRIDKDTGRWTDGAQYGSRGPDNVCGPAWAVDLAVLPDNGVLMVGRQNFVFPWSNDAWQTGDPEENPSAFLRVYSPEFDLQFSTALRAVVPFEVVLVGQNRFVVVGSAAHGAALTTNAAQPEFKGQTDGYLMVVEWGLKSPPPVSLPK